MQPIGPITIETTLGPGQILFRSMRTMEALGQPFRYEVEFVSGRDDLRPSDLVGQPVTVSVEIRDLAYRHWNGFVTRLEYLGTADTRSLYRMLLRPAIWFLSRRTNCRIFQNTKIPDIVTQVLREHGLTDFELSLDGSYAPLEYVVQYRESDLNFVSRLLERAGIYYFFRHAADKHTLVLADSGDAHAVVPGYAELVFRPPDAHRRATMEYVEDWNLCQQVVPGVYAHADYDFERPQMLLYATRAAPKDHAGGAFDLYEYPGGFREPADGDEGARLRLEQEQVQFERVMASSNARGLSVGALFSLTEHPREDQNREYLVVSQRCTLRGHDPVSGGDDLVDTFSCEFEAVDSRVPYRTPLTTPKPFMRGPQTATVVGKSGEDIWTDQYGRVKVQFHWDREGQRDENSSCFVRVSQVWAGDQWGAIHIPRIGQEVIVDFLEGDPDRPIITGRVYNGTNLPPYPLPEHQTQSGIKSRSTKDGGPDNFNEIRFEDKKGEEELYIQAEKNHTVLVKNDQSSTIKANRSASVGGSDSVSVGGDRSVTVNGNLSVTVKGGGKSPVHSETTVTGKHALHASDTIEIDAPTHIKLTVGGSTILILPGSITFTAGDGTQVTLDAAMLASAAGGGNLRIDANVAAASKEGSTVVLDANAFAKSSGGSTMLLDANVAAESSGKSKLVLDSNAALTTNGDAIVEAMNIQGTGKTQVTMQVASNSCQLSPAGAAIAGATVNVNGTGMVSIAGPMIKIG